MKICLSCRTVISGDGWRCQQCDYEPATRDGFLTFAPELALTSDGFSPHFFSELAQREVRNFWFRSRNRLILWALEHYLPGARSFFEIGCGTGYVLSGIRAAYPQMCISGSDVFTEGLGFAEQRSGGVPLFQIDARALPFLEEFDVVGAFDVLEHIEEDEAVLRQIHEAVVPSGGLLITVPQHPQLWSAIDEYSKHKRRYTRRDLLAKLDRAGFDVLGVTSFVTFLLPLMFGSRLRQPSNVDELDPSSEYTIGNTLNLALELILLVELALIKRGGSFPVGGSLLIAARKR